MEIGDEFLEAMVEGFIFLSEGLLGKFSKVGASSGFDVKGIESGFKVFSEFIEGLFFGIDGGVGHSVIPHFGKVDTSTLTHLVQGSHDFNLVSGVKFGVDSEVGPHGLDPVYGVCGITREVSGEGCFKLRGGRRHWGRWSGGYWVTRGGLSPDAKGSGGHCGCEQHGYEAGVEGLIFLITRVWVGREAPSGVTVGNV